MANPNFDDDEKPLDPAVQRVERRVRGLMLVGGLTLALGIFAVFGAILYKIVAGGNSRTAPPALPADGAPRAVAASLPEGARLISTALDGDRMALTYDVDGGALVLIVDLRSGLVISRLRIDR